MKKKTSKVCTKCGAEKSLSEFYYHRKRKYYMTDCKECNKKRSTEFQKKGYRKTIPYVFYQRAFNIWFRNKGKHCNANPVEIGFNDISSLKLHLISLWKKQDHKCFYTGKEMALTGYGKDNLAMTVDRKNSDKGYVKRNIVLCSSIVNRMKQNLSIKELLKICECLLKHDKERR